MSRRHPSSPTAEPLEIDDLLNKILFRLPPLPSSLPRASAISKRWRGLVCDPRFIRRFCIHHRCNPPLLGCFVLRWGSIYFEPALEGPNRVPEGCFTFPIDAGDRFMPLGCRHGLMLILHASRNQFLVWEPITGDQHRLDIPTGIDDDYSISAAVLRAAGDVRHFRVVVVGKSDMRRTQMVARVYSSDTGLWGDLISTSLPSEVSMSYLCTSVSTRTPVVMAGDSLYWLLGGDWIGILEFDLVKQCLAVIQVPNKEQYGPGKCNTWNILAEGGGLCFFFMSGTSFNCQLWKWKTDSHGVASWVPGRTTDLGKLLSLDFEGVRQYPFILGCAEYNNVVLLWTSIGVFTLQLESLQFKKVLKSYSQCLYYPFEGVYTADTGSGGGQRGAELLHGTEDGFSG